MTERTANLIDQRGVTVALLADPFSWRVRVVEEISVDSATSCTRRRSLQVAPLRGHLREFVSRRDTHALVALNVAPMPRGPLIDFHVRGPHGDGWLLPRAEIAARQAAYLLRLSHECDVRLSIKGAHLLRAILGFTGEWFSKGVPKDLTGYFRDGLGYAPAKESLGEWSVIATRCRAVLRPRADKPGAYSAPEDPSLVLPQMFADNVVSSEQEASEVLDDYCRWLEQLDLISGGLEPTASDELLLSLADYANYYDLIVAMRVPLDEPFLVRIAERRDLHLSLFTNEGEQDLVVADAQTNHVTFNVQDPNVRISGFKALQPGADAFAFGAFQSRTDQQSRAFYAHDPDRDYRIRLTFRLALLRRLQLVPYVAALLLAALSVGLLISHPTSLTNLALIVGPSALAASVLLYREPTTLGSRLKLMSSVLLIMALLTLIGIAVFLYVSGPSVMDLR